MFASVCFHHSLTLEQSQKLEMQQKQSLAVILGSEYHSYSHALTLTSLPWLDFLRKEACLKWAIGAQRNPLHTDLFPLNTCQIETRAKKTFKEYRCTTTKFYKSAVPAMTRQLNRVLWSYLWLVPIVAVKDGVISSSLVESPDVAFIAVFSIINTINIYILSCSASPCLLCILSYSILTPA